MGMKRMYALIVCMTLCDAVLFAQAEANFTIKAEGGGVEITRYRGQGGDVVIPATIGGKAVVGIGAEAFQGYKWLTSVTIPEGVISIGRGAFSQSGLTSVMIPTSVVSIGSHVFYGCSSLTSVTISANVTSIGEWVFAYCSSLKTISVSPENRQYKDIDGVLFTKDGKMLHSYPAGGRTVYTIPPGVISIGEWAFAINGLASVTIPSSVTSIGDRAFHGCTKLTSVTIPTSVKSIGEGAFYRCSGLKPEIRVDIEKRFGSGVFW
jgi:hypothetical protein